MDSLAVAIALAAALIVLVRWLVRAKTAAGPFNSGALGSDSAESRAKTQMMAPIAEALAQVDQQVAALERGRQRNEGALSASVQLIGTELERLRAETNQLVGALRRPEVRGAWGEMQLKNVVKAAGLTEQVDFHLQERISDGARTLRPDMTVHLPSGHDLVVDAKTPLDAYLSAVKADDPAERQRQLARHAKQLRRHLDQLASKDYQAHVDTPAELVVCFLPNEAVYAAALDEDPELLEFGARKRVLMATPTTLLALLYAVAYGWQEARVDEAAKEVAQAGRELHRRMGKFVDDLARTGRQLGSAVRAYNAAAGSWEARIVPQARRLEAAGARSSADLPAIEPVEGLPRTLSCPDDPEGTERTDEAREGPEPALGLDTAAMKVCSGGGQ